MRIQTLNQLKRLFKRSSDSHYQSLLKLWPHIKPHWVHVVISFLFIIATGLSVLWLGYGLRQLIDKGFHSIDQLTRSVSILSFFILLLALSSYGRLYFVSQLGEKVALSLRRSLFRKLLYLDANFYENHMAGDLLSRLVHDTGSIQGFISSSFPIILRNLVITVGGLVLLYLTNLKLALILSSCLPVVVILLAMSHQLMSNNHKRQQEGLDILSVHAEEVLSSVKTVQAFGQESFEDERFNKELNKNAAYARSQVKIKSLLALSVVIVGFGTIALVVWVGGKDVISGAMTSGQLTVFCFYALAIAGSLGVLSESWADIQRTVRSTKRLIYLWDITSRIPLVDLPKPLNKKDAEFHISFKNVSFSYPSRPHLPVLRNVTFDIPYGQTIAFVGPSGSGKTTLFELLMRFYDPQEGEIYVGGQEIRTIPLTHLRNQMGLVSQECMVFSGTVYDNIAYGTKTPSKSQIMEVARLAKVSEFVKRLPKKFNSYVGQRGISLSGGQKQRISIARTLLKNAPILLLDEATSSLDAQQEAFVQQAVERLVTHRTTLVIAHRLTTVQRAERIFVLENGSVAASGTHRELLKTSRTYKNLATLQFLDKEAEG
ncbi:MAG: ABC transporter ATP-binding protein [Alphaproteobacteria bacterium]